MNENGKGGRRRPLAPSQRNSAHLVLLSRSCLLVLVLLLTTTCHEATRLGSDHKRSTRSMTLIDLQDQMQFWVFEKGSRYFRRRSTEQQVLPSPSVMQRTLGNSPTLAPAEEQDPEKPSLQQATNLAPDRDDTKSLFTVDLSVAIIVDAASNASNVTYEHNAVMAISKALDVIIVNDTEYELQTKSNITIQGPDVNETQNVESTWVYTLKQNNATAKSQENATECLVDGSNETVTVMWIRTVVEYLILPERRYTNDSLDEAALDLEEEDSEDNIFEPLETVTERVNTHHWDWDTVGSTIINATIKRVEDGSILEWIQHQDLSVVGVSQVGLENMTTCIVVDMNPTLDIPIPFIDPLDLASWDTLQMLGLIMFLMTLLGTSSLCLIGRNRSKALRVEQWTAIIGDESAVNEFLTLSSQFLPPECIYKRDENAAPLVTIPGAEKEARFPIQDDAACCVSSHQCNERCRHNEL